eukprot:scaffold255047_cov45-Prasinocladus_malaysianus.AAC.1
MPVGEVVKGSKHVIKDIDEERSGDACRQLSVADHVCEQNRHILVFVFDDLLAGNETLKDRLGEDAGQQVVPALKPRQVQLARDGSHECLFVHGLGDDVVHAAPEEVGACLYAVRLEAAQYDDWHHSLWVAIADRLRGGHPGHSGHVLVDDHQGREVLDAPGLPHAVLQKPERFLASLYSSHRDVPESLQTPREQSMLDSVVIHV